MEEAVFQRIAALETRRQRLQELCSTPAELGLFSKADLEELRHFSRPPQPVRECLEVVYIVLHVGKVARDIDRLPPDGRLPVDWRSVQAMMARFDTLFPSMENYDIAPLMAAPSVAHYLARAYFGAGGLTQERVHRSNVACAALFRWCSRSMARVEAALELLRVKEELLALSPAQSSRWRCETDQGWLEYPAGIDARIHQAEAGLEQLNDEGAPVRRSPQAGFENTWYCGRRLGADAIPGSDGRCGPNNGPQCASCGRLQEAGTQGSGSSGMVDFELNGMRYEIDVRARRQRNLDFGTLRPIRNPGDAVDLRALQGSWHTSWGSDVAVRGTVIEVDGEAVGPELEPLPDGGIRWTFLGEWRVTGGSPLCVEWQHGNQLVTWVPTAGPPGAEGREPTLTWNRQLSHPELVLSRDGRTVRSHNEAQVMRAAFGGPLSPMDRCDVPITYNHGGFVFLVVGVCHAEGTAAWNDDGSFRNEWDNGTHRGCWMYSFFYNQFSADGSPWRPDPASFEPPFASGDQLVIEVRQPSVSFFYRQRGSGHKNLLGSLEGLTGDLCVVALLGGNTNQSVEFPRL